MNCETNLPNILLMLLSHIFTPENNVYLPKVWYPKGERTHRSVVSERLDQNSVLDAKLKNDYR